MTHENVYDQLLLFLQDDLLKKKEIEGWDEGNDQELREYGHLLRGEIQASSPARLQEVLDQYQYLFGQRGPLHIEQKILQTFPDRVMVDAGYKPLRIDRGLPRIYRKDCPAISRIKKHFCHLPSIKKVIVRKLASSQYAKVLVDERHSIVVLRDPQDPFARMVIQVIQKAFPALKIYDTKDQIADLIIDLRLDADLDDCKSVPVGRYGCIEEIHPETNGFSLGLHFLEAGIITTQCDTDTSQLEQRWLKKQGRFFYADLHSLEGTFVYLHSLCKMLQHDDQDINVCIPNKGVVAAYLMDRDHEKRLEKIQKLVVQFDSQSMEWNYHSEGKILRILCPDHLSDLDIERLIALSQEWVGCSSEFSISVAISQAKCFFYDPPMKNRYLLKDLMALAHHDDPLCVTLIQQWIDVVQYRSVYREEGIWVDEWNVQREDKNLLNIGEELGALWQEAEMTRRFKKLSQTLKEKYSGNAFLCQFVQRAIDHRNRSEAAHEEDQMLTRFI